MEGSGAKRKRSQVQLDDGSVMEIVPLGAGSEVGRSCIIVKFKGKQVMLDCGIHPAFAGMPALPYFDEIDMSEIDLVLISHFHLDHAAAIPYLTEKTGFKGKVFMTHPTKAVFRLLLADYVKVSHHQEDMLYDEQDLQSCLTKIVRVNYHEENEHNGIKFHCYNAGHVLGAAMFMFDIAGVRVLYTGDFSKYDDRHLVGAENPPFSPDVLIVESTYGVQVHEPQQEREARFTRFVHKTVSQGGRCLIPVFALGRAQELLLILEEHWKKNPQLHHVKIFYASSLAKRCMTVFQTYINMMNSRIQKQFEVSNPFMFKHIVNLKGADQFRDSGPVVVMTSPAMLQSGLSRELFERWASDKRNGVIIPGYCVEGTLAKQVMSHPATVKSLEGHDIELHMDVAYTSFSAHSDFAQTSEFVRDMKPKHIVLVHGDPNEMRRLKDRLNDEHEGRIDIHTPKNCERVKLTFQGEKMAKVVGSLAKDKLKEGDVVSGLLIGKDFDHSIVAPEDLSKLTNLHTTTITQRQLVPFRNTFGLLAHMVAQMYERCVVNNDDLTITVHDQVTLKVTKHDRLDAALHRCETDVLSVEWDADPVADMVADSLLSLVLMMESNPAVLQAEPKRSEEEQEQENADVILRLLRHHFTTAQYDAATKQFTLSVNNVPVVVHHTSKSVECEDEQLKEQVTRVLQRIQKALYPLE